MKRTKIYWLGHFMSFQFMRGQFISFALNKPLAPLCVRRTMLVRGGGGASGLAVAIRLITFRLQFKSYCRSFLSFASHLEQVTYLLCVLRSTQPLILSRMGNE